jgi:hypothetical protein
MKQVTDAKRSEDEHHMRKTIRLREPTEIISCLVTDVFIHVALVV